ncbi:MAG TPA: TldD/PmbA family protein [candidate division WOR-3 bacterium]|uniref:TldD/PmbA family protein n=1 Tax=candidate division WOR-3 bacterium TaxID=2052148 RepID=A0A7V0T5P8_UNCW3|nr:TldD/PmbA family protein [candidate division WOR-3 bacterium]
MRVDAVLAMAGLRADAAEVYVEETDRTVVEFRAGQFRSQETRLERGCGLRVVREGRLGFAASSNDERYDELVDAALEAAGLGGPAGFAFAAQPAPPPVATGHSRVMLYPPRRMAEWGRELCSAMRSRVPEMRLDLTFTRTRREVRIATTGGADAGYERTTFDLHASGLIAGAGSMIWLPEYVNLSDGRPFELEPLCNRLEQTARHSRRRARARTGDQPVIVTALALPALLAPLPGGTSGRHRQKRISPLIGREGERVLADCLSVTDNPHRACSLAAAPFDGEGVATRPVPLFERGAFRGFLYDLDSAADAGVAATGSARREYPTLPAPGFSNLEIAPGTAGLEEALRATGSGLLVCQFVGGGQSNLLAGEVALNAISAYRFERGEITGRVKDAMVTGNVYEMLATVDLVGDEQRDLGRWFLPWLRFPSLRVVARERVAG